MSLVESALSLHGSSRLQSSMNVGREINKQLQLLFATTLSLKLRQNDFIVM